MPFDFVYPFVRINPEYKFDEILSGYNYNFSIISGLTSGSSFTGGTVDNITVTGGTVLSSTSIATLSADTIYSGSTNLYDIFLTTADGNDITRVQPGTNITTGGTGNNPIVNLSDNVIINSLSATTISGGTIYSGSTELGAILNSVNTISGATDADSSTFTSIENSAVIYYDINTGKWTVDQHVNSESTVIQAKAFSGGTIPKGTPVFIVDEDADEVRVLPTSASASTQMPCVGITTEDMTTSGGVDLKRIVTFGVIDGMDTSAWSAKTILYVSTVTGELTSTRPVDNDTVQIQRIAKVLTSHPAGGRMFVFNSSRTAGLPNITAGRIFMGDSNAYPQEYTLNELNIVTGTGVSNFITKWDGTGSGVTDSIMSGDGSTITIAGNQNTTGTISSGGTDLYDIFSTSNLAAPIQFAASDETSDLVTGNTVVTIPIVENLTLTDIKAFASTAPSGSTITLDVLNNGVSILSTLLTIDSGEKNSSTAAVPVVISASTLSIDDEISIDILGVGSTTAGAGLKISLLSNYS